MKPACQMRRYLRIGLLMGWQCRQRVLRVCSSIASCSHRQAHGKGASNTQMGDQIPPEGSESKKQAPTDIAGQHCIVYLTHQAA